MSEMNQTDVSTRRTLNRVGHELKSNPPEVLSRTARKFGKKRAARQRTAILLSKARRSGADIPRRSHK